MNEKIQYAAMLEMPFSTANVTVMPPKKKRKRAKTFNAEAVKQELIQKVNRQESENLQAEKEVSTTPAVSEDASEKASEKPVPAVSVQTNRKSKKRFKISVIGVQIALIGALMATIILTSTINPNSGINTFFKSVFSSEQTDSVVDERLHSEFAPVITYDEGDYVLQDGVMTLNGKGSIYSPCDGVISSVALDGNGKYTVEIEHSKNFKSRLSGLDYIYGEQGSKVFSNIPVGYMNSQGATLCFTAADGSVISGYQIVDNSVVWAV